MSGPTNPTEVYFDKGAWGWDGTLWRKLNLLWGYNDRWNENLSVIPTVGAFVIKYSTPVPAGYVFECECAFLKLVERATTFTTIGLTAGAGTVILAANAVLATNTCLLWTGKATLKAGDVVELFVNGSIAGDTFIAGVWGYKMKVT